MLKVFRNKRVTKMVLWGILILILPAFVIWGGGGLGGSKSKGPKYAGLIDNKKVSFGDFAAAIAGARCQIILNYFNQPKIVDTLLNNENFMGSLAWDKLILLKEVKKHRIKITDQEVVSYIRSHPLFARNGVFDEKIYQYILRYNMGLDPRRFEEIVRENLAIQRLNEKLTAHIEVKDSDVRTAYKEDNEKFKISYIIFLAEIFADKAEISDEEIKVYYEAHKQEFVLPSEAEGQEKEFRLASFDDVKDSIRSFMLENRARPLAARQARETYEKILELIDRDKLTFEQAASKLGLKVQTTDFFSKTDYIEGIGEASSIARVSSKIEIGELAYPVDTGKGSIIFKLLDTEGFDEEKFKEKKEEYSKRALVEKQNIFLEDYLRKLKQETKINIEFGDYRKYYR